jgi:hypothetical protein
VIGAGLAGISLALLRDAGDLVYGLARRHGIECDGVRVGYFMVSEKAREIAGAEGKVERWRTLGFRMRVLGRDDTLRAYRDVAAPRSIATRACGRAAAQWPALESAC